jgi:hypothetical protein
MLALVAVAGMARASRSTCYNSHTNRIAPLVSIRLAGGAVVTG